MQTYNGSDSAGVRGQSLSESRIEVCIKEDRTYDYERDHVYEDIGYYAVRGDVNRVYLQIYVDPPPLITIWFRNKASRSWGPHGIRRNLVKYRLS